MKLYAWLSPILIAAALSADPPVFVMATAAGYVPGPTPIALQQHLVAPLIVAYDPWGMLYYGTAHQVWRLNADGTAALIADSLNWVGGLAIDAQQNVYLSDVYGYEIRKITSAGVTTRFAGTGAPPANGAQSQAAAGVAPVRVPLSPGPLAIDSGTLYVSDGASSSVLAFPLDGKSSKLVAASLFYPGAIAVAKGVLYIDEAGGARIRYVNLRTGAVSTLLEWGGKAATDNGDEGLAADSDGTLYAQQGHTIIRVQPSTATPDVYVEDPALLAPRSLAVDPVTHDLAIADSTGNVVQVVSVDTHTMQIVAGMVHFAGDNGPAALAIFNGLEGVVSDPHGNLYVADTGNNRIRKIDTNGIVTTVAGNGIAGFSGDYGPAASASLNLKHAPSFANNLAIDGEGNLFVSDYGNGRIRRIDTSGIITTVAGGGKVALAPGLTATSALLQPGPLAVDAKGLIYFGQVLTGGPAMIPSIYRIDAAGRISPFAGGPSGRLVDVGQALATPIGYAYCVIADTAGNLYICDSAYGRVRKVSPDGMMTTVAIPPAGPPTGVTIDSSGNLFLCAARQVFELGTNGTLAPVAGAPSPPTSGGDGDYAVNASFAAIAGIAFDRAGSLYLTDGGVWLRQAIPVGGDGLPPIILSGGITGAGGSNPPIQAVSPAGLASIFGANFSSPGRLCVSFGGVNAPVMSAFPNQLNVQVPPLPPGPVTVRLTVNCGALHPLASNIAGVTVDPATPEFFVSPDATTGLSMIAASNAGGGPIVAGAVVEAYGTGWGDLSSTSAVTLTLAGTPVLVLYAGTSPCCAGLYQVDFIIPGGTPAGKLPLVLNLDGISSPANAYITVSAGEL